MTRCTQSSGAETGGAVNPMVPGGWYPGVGTGGMSVAGGKRLPGTLREQPKRGRALQLHESASLAPCRS